MRTSRKRTIAIIVPVTVLALAGIATAAGLTTTSTTLGGGSTTVTNGCSLSVSYDLVNGVVYQAYVPAGTAPVTPAVPGGYYLSRVVLTPNVNPDCNSAQFRITVAKADGTSITEATGALSATGTAPAFTPLLVKPLAKDVGAVYATITSPTLSTGVAP
ncbi:MAG: hypothetical protein H7233_04650 [Pseudorhodobacter sp.]|nr:hypothetical protein [Frankiaceae bacterium]